MNDYVESTTDLLDDIVSDAKELAAGHAERIKLEIRQELDGLKSVIRMTGTAIAVVVLGGLLIAQAIAYGLTAAIGIPLWASFGSVAIAIMVAGYVAYRSQPPAEDLVPEESLAAVKNDLKRVRATVKSSIRA